MVEYNRDYSVILLSVFHRMRSCTPVKAVEVTSTPGTKVNIPPTLQLSSSVDADEFLLSLPELYQDPGLTPRGIPDYGLLSTCIRPTGVCWVQGAMDPCLNMWCRPVSFEGHIWPTHKHAIVGVKLGATSEIPMDNVFEELTTKTGTNPFQAMSFGKDHIKPNLLQGWRVIHLEAVFKIILSATFSDAVFLHCLLDPALTAFIHI